MIVVILILLSLGVAGFIMLSDTRKNDSFKRLEQAGGDAGGAIDAGSHADAGSCDAGGDGGGGGCD